jgi:hypothetical protein
MRNQAGITERFPAGMDEVIFSNVTKPECGDGCGPGRGRVPAREYACIFLEKVTDNKEFSREKNKRNRSIFLKKRVVEKMIAINLKFKKIPGSSTIFPKEKTGRCTSGQKKELREQTRNFKSSLR